MRSEIQQKMDFGILRYSMVWEDIELLYSALEIGLQDDVLSITSAGDNVLGLLLKEPRSITAIDLSLAQNALLELKIAAIQSLEWPQFLELLGVRASNRRTRLYEKLRLQLSERTRGYWDASENMINKGVLMQGRLETYIGGFASKHLYGLVNSSVIADFLSLEDTFAQKMHWASEIETPQLRSAFEQYFGEENMASYGRDPAQFEYVTIDVGTHFWNRFHYACTEIPLRNNFYIHCFLTGGYGRALPPYLMEQNFTRLRALVNRVDIVTEPIESYLSSSRKRFSKANLSNIFEYMSEENMKLLLSYIHDYFTTSARLAYWSLLVSRGLPHGLNNKFVSLEKRAGELWRNDRSWFYRAFHILKTV